MTNAALHKQRQVLDSLVAKAKSLPDIELQSHWAKYLCVLISGFLENSVKELYGDYLIKTASPPSAKWGAYHLKQIRNPKAQKLIEIARQFSETMAADLETFLDIDGRKDAIDSIMNHRHNIAHGKATTLSMVPLKEYWTKSIDVIDHTETLITAGP